jgi:hypothetical protein
MADSVNPNSRSRDECYVDEMSRKRPLGQTRYHWDAETSPSDGMHEGSESAAERMNRELREGHAGRNAGER